MKSNTHTQTTSTNRVAANIYGQINTSLKGEMRFEYTINEINQTVIYDKISKLWLLHCVCHVGLSHTRGYRREKAATLRYKIQIK